MEAPQFIGVFNDLSVPLGEDARFVCQVVALPSPEVSWSVHCLADWVGGSVGEQGYDG